MDFSHVKDAANSNQITRAYFDGLLCEARYLDSVVPDLKMDLYGQTFESPIMIAAFSHLSGTHPNGMVEMALGAKQSGICNWAGMGDQAELESIIGTGAQTIKIVKPYVDRQMIFDRLQHAYENGALAVGMDIDHSFTRKGTCDSIAGLDMSPVTAEELAEFVKATPLPFIVKGVLSMQDAEKCVKAGVKGLLVSHHHGLISCAIPPLMLLPQLHEAFGDQVDLFVDCGIASGYDAFKALALGAKAVNVGRAVLPSLQKDGKDGVEAFVAGMNDQLRGMMAQTGCATLDQIDASILWNLNK